MLGAGALGFGAGLLAVQPRKTALPLPDGNSSRPHEPTGKRRVVVVGGGLGGLAAATELAARHFDVTLVERAAQLGGKLTAWPRARPRRGVSRRARLPRLLRAVLQPARAPRRRRRRFRPRAVARLSGAVRRSPARDLRTHHAAVSVQHAVGRAPVARAPPGRLPQRRRRALPSSCASTASAPSTASTASTSRASPSTGASTVPMVETVLEPFGKTTLNRVERLSAAEAIRFFHFYFMGNPEGLGFSYLLRDSVTAMMAPLARRFGARRAHPHRQGCPRPRRRRRPRHARDRRCAPGAGAARDARARRRAPNVARAAASRRLEPLRAPPRRRASTPSTAAARTWAARWRSTTAAAFAAHATAAASTPTASRPAGPPKAPLAALAARAETAIGSASAIRARSATGVSSAGEPLRLRRRRLRRARSRELHERVRLRRRTPSCARHVAALGEAEPYVVWRLWLDEPTAHDRGCPSIRPSRYRFTDSLAIYSAFQEPFVSLGAAHRRQRRRGPRLRHRRPRRSAAGAGDARGDVARAVVAVARARRRAHPPRRVPAAVELHAAGRRATTRSGRRTTTPLANLMLAGDHVRAAGAGGADGGGGDVRAGSRPTPSSSARACVRTTIPTVALKGPLA